MELKELRIGKLVAKVPIFQGGMAIRLTTSRLAAAVANEGGIGLIAASGMSEDELRWEIRNARKLTNGKGIIGINCMVAASAFLDLITVAAEEGIDVIVADKKNENKSKEIKIKGTPSELIDTLKDNLTIYTKDGKLKNISEENHKIDVMSLALNSGDFNTINANSSTESKIVKPVSAELLEQDGGGFKIDAGLKLFGGSTRAYRKKSYELKFKKRYGDPTLHYQVFDDVDSAVYNSLVLRTGSQDEFAWSKRILIRDIMATTLMKEHTNVDVQSYKPVAMYINGKYWGLYFIREKIDETFVANHYNVAATTKNTDLLRVDGEVKSGSNKAYKKMISFMNNNSLSNKNNYAKIKEQVDIENMCDYWIAEIYASNYDILNVRYFRNPEVDNGKWKFVFYDMDSAYYNVNVNYYTFHIYFVKKRDLSTGSH